MLAYCFESSRISSVLAKCRKNDLAVVDTEGYEAFDVDATQLVTNNILIFRCNLMAAFENGVDFVTTNTVLPTD